MSRSVSLTIISISMICLMVAVSITSGLAFSSATHKVKVVIVQAQPVLNDQQKVEQFVHELMVKRQADCLLWIFKKESHINPKAKSKHSSAKGVGQLLESTYRNIGLKHSADPLAQVVASIAYISRHYGADGACAAKSFWQKNSYY
jgi:Transglycosylase SLT domain